MTQLMKYTINDKSVSKGEWVSSKEDGVHKAYYESGVLECEISYVNGQVHGVHKEYLESGVLQYKALYINGRLREDLKDNRLAQVVLFGEVSNV